MNHHHSQNKAVKLRRGMGNFHENDDSEISRFSKKILIFHVNYLKIQSDKEEIYFIYWKFRLEIFYVTLHNWGSDGLLAFLSNWINTKFLLSIVSLIQNPLSLVRLDMTIIIFNDSIDPLTRNIEFPLMLTYCSEKFK